VHLPVPKVILVAADRNVVAVATPTLFGRRCHNDNIPPKASTAPSPLVSRAAHVVVVAVATPTLFGRRCHNHNMDVRSVLARMAN
jgi:hypothetical protein